MSATENRNEGFQSLDQLMAASIDDLDDLPAFETPPPGAYILDVSCGQKEINRKPTIEAKLSVVETVELKNPEDKPPVAGTQFSQLFQVNPVGIGKLKEFLAPFAVHFNEKSIGVLVRDHLNSPMRIACTIGNRKDKEDPERIYATVKNITVA